MRSLAGRVSKDRGEGITYPPIRNYLAGFVTYAALVSGRATRGESKKGEQQMAIPSAATVADRWANSAGAAQQRYSDGVQATTKDPTQLAIAQQGKLLSNFGQAVSSGRWARNLAKTGKAGWQAAAVAKAGNYGTGIAASKTKFETAMGPVLAQEASLQSQISSMPSATIADSIARMAAWANGMHNWKLSR